jgi:hypothetical protein
LLTLDLRDALWRGRSARQLWGMAVDSPSPHGIQFALQTLGVRGERLRSVPLLAGVGVRGTNGAELRVAPNLT